jgi:hypothetical protein
MAFGIGQGELAAFQRRRFKQTSVSKAVGVCCPKNPERFRVYHPNGACAYCLPVLPLGMFAFPFSLCVSFGQIRICHTAAGPMARHALPV